MKFKEFVVKCTSAQSEDVAYALHELGSMGEVFSDYSVVKDVLDNKSWDYADSSLFEPTENCSVSGFFDIEANDDSIAQKIALMTGENSVEVKIIDSVDWENEWKKYYKPLNIGKIVIIPEWIPHKPTDGSTPVYLNPGLAFGTGMHETTSMCIDFMQKIDVKNKRILDFGCGSGILGICATALGADDVLFADTDEQAISATEYNCMLNGIADPNVTCRDVREISVDADVVLANITADVLCDVEPIIATSLKKGGFAILSGIITPKLDIVKSTYDKAFTLVEQQTKNEWSALLYKL